MDIATILGGFGSACTIGSFLPQAWKVANTGDTQALSTKMYILTVVGFSIWSAYGLMLGAWPIIVTNFICLLTSAYILYVKLRCNAAAPLATADATI